ncbi:LacI family DNA-binding transcriptional regulator [Paenibacillus algorifonticola]|uniref:LacI family DNA-binding transcriptional regulator n=1 Tax=Paenibacillus algorifonticola TaxID=684063 RepID=UPI003D278C00
MVTIKDIAKKANVAISTVSYVLNGTKNVKPETKERIMNAIKELNYHPSMAARSLKSRKTLTIGIVVPDISNAFFTEIIRGIEDLFNEHAYSVILCNTDEDQAKELRYLNTLFEKDIDGLIFLGTGKNRDVFNNRKDFPVVVVDRKVVDKKAGESFSSVMIDNVHGGFEATNFLLSQNRSEVMLVIGDLSIQNSRDRLEGYKKALALHGVAYDESLVYECKVSHEAGYVFMDKLLEKPFAYRSIFAANDLLALGIMKALFQKGYRIPEDIAIVGYDNIPTSYLVVPALTTINQPKYQMGKKAGELLLKKINAESHLVEHIVLKPELVIREST